MSSVPTSFDDDESPKRPLELRAVLHRRRWWALLTLLVGLAAAGAAAFALPDVYRSNATILIERQQIPDELVRSTVTSQLEIRLQTISKQILSRSRLEELIEQFGLYPEMRGREPMERIVERMRGEIEIQMSGDKRRAGRATVSFSVGYRGRNATKVANVANAIASFFIEENLKARGREATGTADFLGVQMEQLKEKLEKQEAEVSAFKERHLGQLPEQLDANLKTLERLNGQLRLNSDNQVQANARRAAIETQLGEALDAAGGGPDAYAAHLTALRRQLAMLRTRFTDQYPDVIRVREEIARLEAQAAASESEPGAGAAVVSNSQVKQLRQSLSEVDVDLARFRAEGERLRSSIALYERRVEAAPRREQEFHALSREYQSTQEQYRSMVGRHSEALLGESMEQREKGETFRTIEPALPEERPSAPKRVRLLLFGLLGSLALAAGVVFVREAFDPAVHSRQEVEACAPLPVLVSVPVLSSKADRRRRRLRLAAGTMLAVVGLVAVMGASYRFAKGNTTLAVRLSR